MTRRHRCFDGFTDGAETDVDCGGICPRCAAGKRCNTDGDCASGVCSTLICVAP